MAELVRVSDGDAALPALRDHGCVIVEGVLGSDEIRAVSNAVTELERGHPLGRNVFEGERSHRLYSLIVRGRPFVDLAQHPIAVAILDSTSAAQLAPVELPVDPPLSR